MSTARAHPGRPEGSGDSGDEGGVRYEFSAPLWRWEARADVWVFLRLPDDASAEISDVPRLRAGFGAVRVRATLGGSRWSTSIFPESEEGPYVLPVKKAVRAAERVEVGDVVRVAVEVLG